MERARQRKTVEIDRGLFLVRYAAAEDMARPPRVAVSVDRGAGGIVSLLLHPDHRDAVLWQPGTCLVVSAATPGRLCIEVRPGDAGGSAVATVQIEPISQGRATAVQSPARGQGSSNFDVSDFQVLGHIAGRGDVVVSANEWLGGPSAPSRIEGISIKWPGKPNGLDIRYSVKTARPQATSGRLTALGAFAGTRSKALAVVGVVLEISGPSAADFSLMAETVFRGSPIMRVSGERVVLSGPTGQEPLVGLRLQPQQAGATIGPQASPLANKQRPPSSRVRVFRGRSKPDESAAFHY